VHGKAGMPEDLVEALKRKEPAAFEWLMARHGSLLHRVAWRLMGQQEEAEEVLQETFLKVYEKIHTFDGGAALTTWLYRIVVNMALMRLRAKRRVPMARLDAVGQRVSMPWLALSEGRANCGSSGHTSPPVPVSKPRAWLRILTGSAAARACLAAAPQCQRDYPARRRPSPPPAGMSDHPAYPD
jgi:DNA-directed RNA polymerase specialized sigma24 family protein